MKFNQTIQKLLLMGMFTLGSFVYSQAQVDKFPKEPGKYFVDTIYNKPYSYNLLVNAGFYADFDVANNTGSAITGGGIYGYARYILLRRVAVSGFIGMAPFKLGNADLSKYYINTEVKGAIFFKREYQPKGVKFKLGQDGQYKYSCTVPVMSGSYLGITGGTGFQKRVTNFNDLSAYQSWTIEKKDANGNFVVDTNKQVNISAQVSYAQMSGGFLFTQSSNGKFKVYMHANSGLKRRFTRRSKNAIDMAIEVLYAPIINVQSAAVAGPDPTTGDLKYDEGIATQYRIVNPVKKHLGWRMQGNMKSGIMSLHFEFGGRPGVKNVLDEKQRKIMGFMNNLYMHMGVGIGIGAL